MASPSMTINHAAGNLLASASIAASANTTFDIDYSAKFGGVIQVSVTFGTVAATAGINVQVFARVGSGPAIDTIAITNFTIPATGSTTVLESFRLDAGRYRVKLTNLDGTNGVTGVTATDDTIDAIA